MLCVDTVTAAALDAIDARCVLRATATSSTACEGATLDAIDAT